MDIKLFDFEIDHSPKQYQAPEPLVKALEIAYALKRPLLLSGEPGTGKTDFARWAAENLSKNPKLNFAPKPLIYNTKSTSVAQDLFYFYDAVGHFRGSKTRVLQDSVAYEQTSVVQSAADDKVITEKDSIKNTELTVQPLRTTEDFIEFKALGLAFARAIGREDGEKQWPIFAKKKIDRRPQGSVVLIDEVDKAPRDFPNDLLNEIESYEFEIRELNNRIWLEKSQQKNLVVILTSNFEKNLPEAFLRRCIYYHIEFPKAAQLLEIVTARLGIEPGALTEQAKGRVDDFLKLRDLPLQKKPSTAELIDFICAARSENLLGQPLFTVPGKIAADSPLYKFLPVLLKKREDFELVTLAPSA